MTSIDHLVIAQHEGLAPNAKRFFRFLGHVPELQVLGMPNKYESNLFAHPTTEERACALLAEVESKKPTGVYAVMNVVDGAVRSRAQRDRWHPAKKGESTSDADIVQRAAIYIDIDWARPKGTSTTNDECEKALGACVEVFERLAQVVPQSSLGLGHSGNCGCVFIALDMLDVREAQLPAKELIHILDLLYTDERIRRDRNARNGIDIDTSVTDAKRLVPAFGTTKRKGADGNPERPHRRTAFVCANDVTRISLGELEDLVVDLRADLPAPYLDELDKIMGRRKVEIRQQAPHASGDDAFARAKEVPIADVLAWCSLGTADEPVCPGCGLTDSGVAVVKNGLKCSHDRCSQKGHAKGFRTTIDVVCEANGLQPIEAVRAMGERFGFKVDEPKAQHAAQPPRVAEAVEQPKPPQEKSKRSEFKQAEHISEPAIRVVRKYLTEGQRPEFVSTGFPDVDELMSIEPQTLVVLGARSGRGKSTLSMQMAMSVAQNAGPTLYFSSEMSSEQLALRAMCSLAKVDSKRVRRATLSADEMGRLTDAGNIVRESFAWLTDEAGLDVLKVKHIAKREVGRIQDQTGKPVKLVVVDYLQRIKAGKAAPGGANREQQVNAIALELKELSRELNVCVMVPAQLNADGDSRGDDARPRASEMRESKGIENEADCILLIHNPNYIRRVEDPTYDWSKPELCEVILGKGRSDGNGKADVLFYPQFTRFESVSLEWKEQQAEKRRREIEKLSAESNDAKRTLRRIGGQR